MGMGSRVRKCRDFPSPSHTHHEQRHELSVHLVLRGDYCTEDGSDIGDEAVPIRLGHHGEAADNVYPS